MFFLITEELVGLAEADSPCGKKAKEVIEFFDIANRLGKHFICVEKPSLCSRIKKLDIKADTIIGLASTYSFDRQISQLFEWHVEVVGAIVSSKDESNKIIRISIDDIPRFELYSETHVIGENYSDVWLFHYILHYYKRIHNCETVHCVMYPLLGGGSTTAAVLKNEQNLRQALCLCISDSDYAFRGAGLGETASSIKKVYKAGTCCTSYYYHLHYVSEAENLIPMQTFSRYSNTPEVGLGDSYKCIERIVNKYPDFLCFFDFKEGFSLRSFDKDGVEEIYTEWISAVQPDIRKTKSEDLAAISITPGLSGKDEKKEWKKSRHYVKGLGCGILDNILNQAHTNGIDLVEEMLSGASEWQKKEYEEIGRLLFNWCCARPKIRL